ncbi:MAG: MipA/OmpV family protein [Pseudomonadota bacterium]
MSNWQTIGVRLSEMSEAAPQKTRPSTIRAVVAASCATALYAAPTIAEEAPTLNGFVVFGPAVAPEFEGADAYEPVPGFVGFVEYDGRTALLTPSDLDVDLARSQRLTIGPSFSYRFARDDVDDARVDRLNDVDAAFEIGANIGLNYGALLDEGDGLSLGLRLTQDVADGHGGFVARGSASYAYPATEKLLLTGGVEITAVSDDYAESYFSVDGAEAARSGLSAFDAEGGFRDVKLSLRADYALSERWGVGAYASYARLVGDFADSSIVDDAGSANQLFGLIGLQYRFSGRARLRRFIGRFPT